MVPPLCKWTASFHIHQDLHASMCVRMCVYECVCVYTRARASCLVLRKWMWEVKGWEWPPGDPNHTQAMHYRRNQRRERGRVGGGTGVEGWGCRKMDQCGGGKKGAKGNSLGLFSTDCPLTNISRLALCIHVQCTFINSTVDDTSGPSLHFSTVERARRDVFDGGWKRVQTAGWGASRGIKEADRGCLVLWSWHGAVG